MPKDIELILSETEKEFLSDPRLNEEDREMLLRGVLLGFELNKESLAV